MLLILVHVHVVYWRWAANEVVWQPMTNEVVWQPMTNEVVWQPITNEVVWQPMTNEVVWQPMTNGGVWQPMTNDKKLIHASSLLNNILILKQININNKQFILFTLTIARSPLFFKNRTAL
jgi:hypothetical protein